ncbi:TRAP transporter substrate-binding protein [Methylobacterium sp. P31]
MTTEYPKGNISGIGLATFAQTVATHTGGLVTVEPTYDSKITSGQLVQAAAEGRVAGGDAFGGPMDTLDPVFALPSLPFIVRSVADARALNARARPAYEAALARHGMRLLYLTLWPPTGLWSDRVLASPGDLQGLRVRTYDDNSAVVLTAAGAHAAYLPFGEAMVRLQRRELDGVLTSGDGGVVRGLWDALPHFTAISYAIPVSFAFVRADAFDALPKPVREQVLTAARETEARQFALLETRVQENYAQMRVRGVSIVDPPPAGLVGHLRESAGLTLRDWRARVPAELRELSEESASR